MKKYLLITLTLVLSIVLSACSKEDATGTYLFQSPDKSVVAFIQLTEEKGAVSGTYTFLQGDQEEKLVLSGTREKNKLLVSIESKNNFIKQTAYFDPKESSLTIDDQLYLSATEKEIEKVRLQFNKNEDSNETKIDEQEKALRNEIDEAAILANNATDKVANYKNHIKELIELNKRYLVSLITTYQDYHVEKVTYVAYLDKQQITIEHYRAFQWQYYDELTQIRQEALRDLGDFSVDSDISNYVVDEAEFRHTEYKELQKQLPHYTPKEPVVPFDPIAENKEINLLFLELKDDKDTLLHRYNEFMNEFKDLNSM